MSVEAAWKLSPTENESIAGDREAVELAKLV
jgi:hypothetical protein